jgi:hypothetical protein
MDAVGTLDDSTNFTLYDDVIDSDLDVSDNEMMSLIWIH